MAGARGLALKRPSAIPGFGLALGFTLTYLSLIVLIPLGGLVLKSATLGFAGFLDVVTGPRTLAALRLSFVTALIAAVINAVFGVIIAWVLIRYRFPGRRLLDAFVDLPFALPTAVAGIALTTLYAPNGWIGSWLAAAWHQGRLYPARHYHRADLHRTAVRSAHRAAGARRVRP